MKINSQHSGRKILESIKDLIGCNNLKKEQFNVVLRSIA